jgi:hypothetical protein
MRISLLLVLVLSGSVLAQEPAQAPSLDALDRQAIALDASAEQLWRNVATKLPEYDQWVKTRALIDAQVKAKYPGHRINWQTRTLEVVK